MVSDVLGKSESKLSQKRVKKTPNRQFLHHYLELKLEKISELKSAARVNDQGIC
jgi:hypothetical protein